MTLLLAVLLFGTVAPEVPPAAPPDELRLQLEMLRTEQAKIHWAAPAVITAVGIEAAFSGTESLLLGAVLSCGSCATYERVGVGLAIGGAVVAAGGIVWLVLNYSHRADLNARIQRLEDQLTAPKPGLLGLRF